MCSSLEMESYIPFVQESQVNFGALINNEGTYKSVHEDSRDSDFVLVRFREVNEGNSMDRLLEIFCLWYVIKATR
jgi:hypothetical protein